MFRKNILFENLRITLALSVGAVLRAENLNPARRISRPSARTPANEDFEKRPVLCRIKAGKNYNRRNISNILRIIIRA
ncbi:MAG: hypothetical protein DRH37_05795 [Deltaproteobacteria bacterium]|nr:MAG: hypothetical protein DRH37_05795 [Deltaproteobacteria bacterium]